MAGGEMTLRGSPLIRQRFASLDTRLLTVRFAIAPGVSPTRERGMTLSHACAAG